MDDPVSILEKQLEKLLDALVKLKAEKRQLLEANEALQKQVKQLQSRVDALQQESDDIKKASKGSQVAHDRMDSLLSRINDALGES